MPTMRKSSTKCSHTVNMFHKWRLATANILLCFIYFYNARNSFHAKLTVSKQVNVTMYLSKYNGLNQTMCPQQEVPSSTSLLLQSSAVTSRFLTCFLTCYPVSVLLCLRWNLSADSNPSTPFPSFLPLQLWLITADSYCYSTKQLMTTTSDTQVV